MTLTVSIPRTFAERDLQSDVEAELERDVRVPSGSVSVSVTDKMVTLSGSVDSRADRLAALTATHRVGGVHTIVDDIVVVPTHGTSEHDVAIAIERVLDAAASGTNGLHATVRAGVITLTGRVDAQSQKSSAGRAIGELRGVRWVDNDIVVEAEATTEAVHARIVAAMHRSADTDARALSIVTRGHEVWLTGKAASCATRTRAVLAARSAPGVKVVHDKIHIGQDPAAQDDALEPGPTSRQARVLLRS